MIFIAMKKLKYQLGDNAFQNLGPHVLKRTNEEEGADIATVVHWQTQHRKLVGKASQSNSSQCFLKNFKYRILNFRCNRKFWTSGEGLVLLEL